MEKQENKKAMITSSFASNTGSSRTPVLNAMMLPLKSVIGDLFALVSATTEEVQDFNDPEKVTNRAVYTVRTLTNKSKLPLGSILTVKIKDSESIFSEKDNAALLLGASSIVVSFDDLAHWNMNGVEGLSAQAIHRAKISLQEAVSYEQDH